MIKKVSILLSLVLLLTCCQRSLLLNKLQQTQQVYGLKASKEIFRSITDSIRTSDHVVYLYVPVNHLPTSGTKDLYAIIYDHNSHKRYYFVNRDTKKLKVTRTAPNPDLKIYNFILNYYLDGKTQMLKQAQHTDISEGGLYTAHIYDIDLKKDTVGYLKLESVLLDKNGMPATLDQFMKQ